MIIAPSLAVVVGSLRAFLKAVDDFSHVAEIYDLAPETSTGI